MRILVFAFLFAGACQATDDGGDDTDTDTETDTDTDVTDICASCSDDATCVGEGDDATCVCDDGYDGDGFTCVDIDECDLGTDACADEADCTNTAGGHTCDCWQGWDGDGETCTSWVDEDRRACAVMQAEHPGYTNIRRDVALCGGAYDPSNIEEACHTGWHVCLESEWLLRYPIDRPYKTSPTDPDLIGPTLGTLTSWGAPQSERCGGDIWLANVPENNDTWSGSVCHDPDDVGTDGDGADYLPWNDGKFLYADDGTTILQGKNAEGELDCCSWDVEFDTTEADGDFAVYCCAD